MEEQYSTLYEKFSKLQWLLQRYRMARHAQHGPFADTSRGQGRVMAALKLQPQISTKDLSYLLGIRIPSLNELLAKLEKNGYIERKPSEADKRVMIIHLTEKGKAAQQEEVENDYSDIFGCLNADELAAFEEYLDRIIAALEAQVATGPDEDRFEQWENAARARMGDEQFERMASSMPWGYGGPWGGHHHKHRHGGHGPAGRGPAPAGMPGTERFDPDYDGPGPEGRGACPRGGMRNPPPPHKGPHGPEDFSGPEGADED